MTTRARTLTKQALERWSYVPKDKQTKLIEELKEKPVGSAVVELGEIERVWNDTSMAYKTSMTARVVSVLFGMEVNLGTSKRYLMLSDIPKPADEPV